MSAAKLKEQLDQVADDRIDELEIVNKQLRRSNERLQKELIKAKDHRAYMAQRAYEAVIDAASSAPPLDITPPKKDKRRKGEEYAISVVGDWQLGKITKSYNSEMCETRIREYTEKVVEISGVQRADHPVKDIHVFFLGDMVEGELIFPGQAHLIDSSLFQQTVIDFPRIAKYMIARYAEEFENVYVHTVPGNHGYLGGRQRKEMHWESNADNFAYYYLKYEFSHVDNVHFNISHTWYNVADLGEGMEMLLLHGNNIKGYNGLPYYGFLKKIYGWRALERRGGRGNKKPLMEGFDSAFVGHFHTPTRLYFNTIPVWINGSTESHNAFAQEQLASMGDPCQYLLFAKPGRGITAEYLVQLD